MDRISGLPDELLLKILLLVPTKVAVSTSILSKRWKYLWLWLPKFDYSSRNSSESDCERLQRFLDRTLPLHKAPVIETFRLELVLSSRFKPESIKMWVALAVSHCPRELEILYESDLTKSIVLPSNLYTCKSLVILKLGGEILLDVPTTVSLPSLKTRKLLSVRYLSFKSLPMLLSKCQVLEDLMVDLREDDTTEYLIVVAPSLQSFSLYIPYDHHHISGFVLSAPALKYFKLMDNNYHYCLIDNMPYLIEAFVDVNCPVINDLIGSIISVKRLSICSKTMFDEGFVFNQLDHLEVCLWMEHSSNQFVRLLKASSKLKRLDISLMDGHDSHQDMVYWNQPSTVPECLLSSLQSLSWSEYSGEPHERDIVVYILKHALHLKTATIKLSESDVPSFEMLKELALSSRASPACQLMFE